MQSNRKARVAMFMIGFALASGDERFARAEDRGAAEPLTAELMKRNAERESADRARAAAARAEMDAQVEASRAKERELEVRDAEIRAAVDAEAGRVFRRNLAGWSLVIGGTIAAAGGVAYATALSAKADIDDGKLAAWYDVEERADRMERSSRMGVGFMITGAFFAAVGAILLLTARTPRDGILETRKRVGVDLDARHGALVW